MKISHLEANTAPYWPQANGEVERQNRSILKRLKIAHAEQKNWRSEILKFLIMYRSTPHTTTGVSPAELMLGRRMRTKLPELEKSKFVEEEVREQDAWKKYKGKEYYDKINQAKESRIERGIEC